MAMDSLTEWYRYIDQVSRPARRPSGEDEEPEQWRPWKPIEDAPPVEAAIPADAIPNLSAALGLVSPVEACHPATTEYVDPTVHDQLAPIPIFNAPSLSAPTFEISIPRLGQRAVPTVVDTIPWLPGEEVAEPGAAEALEPPASQGYTVEVERLQFHAPEAIAEPEPADGGALAADSLSEADESGGSGQGFRHWDLLSQIRSHDIAQNSYKSTFRETREELVQRLLDPPLTLEETARLLGVCPTTVRRYTNKGQLRHFRTTGNQRRFRLSDVLEFLESRATEIEADARADREAGFEN